MSFLLGLGVGFACGAFIVRWLDGGEIRALLDEKEALLRARKSILRRVR